MKLTKAMALVLAALSVSACASHPATDSKFIAANYAAADALLSQVRARVAPGHPILVATVVDVDDLEHSSTLGRLVSEQVSARFSHAGYNVIEMRLRDSVYFKRSEGELLLSRELSDLARSHDARAVVLGTYGVSSGAVYLNVKVVDPGAGFVLGAHDYMLPLTESVQAMLGERREQNEGFERATGR